MNVNFKFLDKLRINTINRNICSSICIAWMRRGVIFEDITTVCIDSMVTLELNVIIGPMTILKRNSYVSAGTRISGFSWIENTKIEFDCNIWLSAIVDCNIDNDVTVEPYAYLRCNCKIADKVSIGAHSELNDTIFGEGGKCKHFSYLGHYNIGSHTNIGAGAITCNYDGKNKYRTIIFEGAFIGSDTMLVAPVEIGKNSMTGAGAVVTKDISNNCLAVGAPAKITRKI